MAPSVNLKVGLYLPQVGGRARGDYISQVARVADESGYDSLWVFDHVVLRENYGTPYPYSADGTLGMPPTTNFLEALTLLSYVAAVTSRIELGTAVLILPMRAPVLHAKIMATLDHLAGGRLVLGAGVGWWKEEVEALSMPWDNRGRRMDEYLRVLKELWSRDVGEFRGEYYDISGWSSAPRPPRPVPILLGGNSRAQLRRVGQFADGWLANPTMLDRLEENFERARQAAQDAGRDPDAPELVVNRVSTLTRGSLEETANVLNGLAERGVNRAIIGLDPREPDMEDLLRRFADEYL